LIVVFRGSAGDQHTAKDWIDFDGDTQPSQVVQEDGVQFTKGFFDISFCVFLQTGLFDVLTKNKEGVGEILTTGHSLGGAWASILGTRLSPNTKTTCPDGHTFMSPFTDLSANIVTFGKPGPFYLADDSPKPSAWSLTDRETDYVYHADIIARANHDAVKLCVSFCWTLLENAKIPFIKAGAGHFIANHYHGDTRTVWILNGLDDKLLPTPNKFPFSKRSQIAVYENEESRSADVNIDFVVLDLSTSVVQAAGDEHGRSYGVVPWQFTYADMIDGGDTVVI